MSTSQPQSVTSLTNEYASPRQAAEAIVGLSTQDKVDLRVSARTFWEQRMRGPNVDSDADDLFQEAVVRTLKGTRRWRKSVTIVMHLIRTMESISWETLRASKAMPHKWTESTVDPSDRSGVEGSTVEDMVLAREDLEQIQALFDTDEEALEALRCRSIELSPSETCARLGITRTRYDTVNKRIWRKLTKLAKNN